MVHLISPPASFRSRRNLQNWFSRSAPPSFLISKFLKVGGGGSGCCCWVPSPPPSLRTPVHLQNDPALLPAGQRPVLCVPLTQGSRDTAGASDSAWHGARGVIKSGKATDASKHSDSHPGRLIVKYFRSPWPSAASPIPLQSPLSVLSRLLRPFPQNPGCSVSSAHLTSQLQTLLVVVYFEYHSWAQKDLDLNSSSSIYYTCVTLGKVLSSFEPQFSPLQRMGVIITAASSDHSGGGSTMCVTRLIPCKAFPAELNKC